MIRFLVRNRSLKAIRFSAPGPDGKGTIAASFAVQGPALARHVDLPASLADGAFADAFADAIASGTLLPPSAPEE